MNRLCVPLVLAAVALAGCGGSSPAASNAASSGSSGGAGTTGSSGGSSSSQNSGSASSGAGTTPSAAATTTSATTTSSATTPTAGPTTTACSAANLALSFLGSQGAAGHGVLGFSLRNTGSSPCHTYGFPGVQFLSAAGAPITTRSSRTTVDLMGTTRLQHLTVQPGSSVSFRLTVSHVSSSPSGCSTAHALAVIPPDDTHTLTVSLPDGADECNGQVTVSPVQPGNSAYAGGQ